MVTVPTYDPGGTQRTQAQRMVDLSPDALGAGIGRGLAAVGGQIAQLGGTFARIEKEAKDRDDTAAVMDVYSEGSARLRGALYDPESGIYNRTGKNAAGVAADVQQTSEAIRADLESGLKTEEQKTAFRQMWQRREESTMDGATKHEFAQNQAYRSEAKTSALKNLEADVVANYKDAKLLATNFDAARAMIRANPDGLSPEGVASLERSAVSSLHVQVIQRLAQDDPGAAADYYKQNKAQVSGNDHAQADKIIGGIMQIRDAKSATQEIMSGGMAGDIVNSVIGAESDGDAAAISSAGALGLMQVMPDTARETAAQIGLPSVAKMSDAELKTFFASKEGQMANKRIGTAYLNKQLATFNGDLEAALVAYNAGPGNATKWLDAGRDYAALPKADETFPYVVKVMKSYLGIDPQEGAPSSQGIQAAAAAGKPRYQGDAAALLKGVLHSDKGADHIDGMKPVMQDSLAAMFAGAPDYVKAGLGILSGHRTVERQTELWNAALKKYGSVAAARKWVAPPPGVEGSKGSKHNHGDAADLGWNGQEFSAAPANVRQWVHENAGAFGLTFPLGNEPWHIERQGARSGKGDRLGGGNQAMIQDRIDGAFGGGAPVTVMLPDAVGSAADIYTKISAPYSVAPDAGNLSSWLETARERYADNPSMLAEVERQLTLEWKGKEAAVAAEVDGMTKEIFRGIMGGQQVSDFDPKMLEKIGPEGVSKLLTLEGKFKPGGEDKTDDATYYKLSKMAPEEFNSVNLIDFADKLSGSDFRSLADRQAAIQRPGDKKDMNVSGMRTGSQVFSDATAVLGLDPNKRPDDAAAAVLLRRQFDEQIAAFAASNGGAAPDAVTMQKIMDGLILQGRVSKLGPDDYARIYNLTPETASRFMVEGVTAETFEDIPPAAHAAIAQTYRKIYSFDPDESGALDLFNDVARINLGAAPLPPDDLKNKISQGLFSRTGRIPSDEEIAATYKRLILRAAKPNGG